MIATLFGGLGGLALGVTGGAGAIVTLPLLVYGLHIPVHQAVLFSLFIVGFSAFAGLMPLNRWQYLEKRVAALVLLGALSIAPLGAYLSQHVTSEHLLFVFSLMMMAVGIFLWRKENAFILLQGKVGQKGNAKPTSTPPLKAWHLLLLSGGVTGFFTGFLGIGGGLLIVPALVLILMLPIKQATSTSLLIILVTSGVAIIAHLRHEVVNWYVLIAYLMGSIFGVFGGAAIAKKIPTVILHRISSLIVIAASIFVLYESSGHW